MRLGEEQEEPLAHTYKGLHTFIPDPQGRISPRVRNAYLANWQHTNDIGQKSSTPAGHRHTCTFRLSKDMVDWSYVCSKGQWAIYSQDVPCLRRSWLVLPSAGKNQYQSLCYTTW